MKLPSCEIYLSRVQGFHSLAKKTISKEAPLAIVGDNLSFPSKN
jgi:hypothetical protein